MALPPADPYKDAAPTHTSNSTSVGKMTINGANFSSWGLIQTLSGVGGAVVRSSRLARVSNGTVDSFTNRYGTIEAYGVAAPGGHQVKIANPVLYTQQTAAHIILAIAHWHAGIAEVDIDVDTFDLVATYEGTKSCERSLALVWEPAIELIKNLLEHTHGIFIYIDADQKLACGYLDYGWDLYSGSEPYQYTLTSENIVTVKSIDSMRDRNMPSSIDYGYDGGEKGALPGNYIKPGDPEFGIYQKEYTRAAAAKSNLVRNYEARCVDNDEADGGTFSYWPYHIRLVVEVDAVGIAMDIGDYVGVELPNHFEGINYYVASFPFIVHSISLDPETMITEVELISHVDWLGVHI